MESLVPKAGSNPYGSPGPGKVKASTLLHFQGCCGLTKDSAGRRAWKTLKDHDHSHKILKQSLPQQEQMSRTCSPPG